MNLLKLENNKITSLQIVEEINFFRGMSSGMYAELQHKELLRTIRDEFEEEIAESKIAQCFYDTKFNKNLPMFELTINQAKQILVRESKVVRKAVIKRLDELENKPKTLSITELLQQSTLMLEELNNKNIVLENKIKEDQHRVSFAETIEKASDSILVRDLSKILGNEGIKLGQNKLYEKLREYGYICKNSTEPTQRAINQGLFKISERIVTTVKGDITSFTTKVTGKGQIFLLDKIKKDEASKNWSELDG